MSKENQRNLSNRGIAALKLVGGLVGFSVAAVAFPPIAAVANAAAFVNTAKQAVGTVYRSIPNATSAISPTNELQQGPATITSTIGIPKLEKPNLVLTEMLNSFSNMPAGGYHTRTHDLILNCMKEFEKAGLIEIKEIKPMKPRSLFLAQLSMGVKPNREKVPYYRVKFEVKDKRFALDEIKELGGKLRILSKNIDKGIYTPKLDSNGRIVAVQPNKIKMKEIEQAKKARKQAMQPEPPPPQNLPEKAYRRIQLVAGKLLENLQAAAIQIGSSIQIKQTIRAKLDTCKETATHEIKNAPLTQYTKPPGK